LASLTELDHRVVPFADPEVHDCIQILRQNILKEARLVNDLIDRFEIPGPELSDRFRTIRKSENGMMQNATAADKLDARLE
jgi:hypothetical protein